MNYFNYKNGELIINNKKHQLTKTQTELLMLLLNNKLNTYEDIYNYLYKTNITKLEIQLRKSINTNIYRLRKKGLKIITRREFGFILKDKIYIGDC